MAQFNIADAGIMMLVALLISLCVRNLINDRKAGVPSCGAKSCSGCAGCRMALQKRQ